MRLVLARHLWGIPEAWEQAFPRIQAGGYTLIEAPLPAAADQARFQALLAQYGFGYIAMIFTAGADVRTHVDSFRAQVEVSQALQPIMINSQSGRDAWDEADCSSFFREALAIQHQCDIPIAHETHRGRMLFTPWGTSRLLEQFDDLRLCCDLSHWVCVCERLLDTEQAILTQVAQRCIHVHARVGYEEGPQVPDPRAPEYQRHVEAHELWWQLIWAAQAAQQQPFSTLTPEYGPPDYLHTLPYTKAPVADLWEICDWQAQRAAARFRMKYGQVV